MRLVPLLAKTHVGFFRVALALVVFHIGLSWDFLNPNAATTHVTGAWQGVTALVGLPVWGWAHVLCVILTVAGLFGPFWIARVGFLASVVTCGALAGSFAYGTIHIPGSSASGFFLCAFATAVSGAALREPEFIVPLVGPLSPSGQ